MKNRLVHIFIWLLVFMNFDTKDLKCVKIKYFERFFLILHGIIKTYMQGFIY